MYKFALKEIEEIEGKRIHELFDLIIGTSTGGIIACGLTATKDGKTPDGVDYTWNKASRIGATKRVRT